MDNMVRHEKHAEIMNAFEAALGVGNVKDNAATVNAYFGDWLPPKTLGMSVPPEFVVLPNGTLETQAVVKVCNRFQNSLYPGRIQPVVIDGLSQSPPYRAD